ncbi:TPA: hypothetical protein P7P38_001235 [Escherichia coli]|nr:hypothetical protein [Escherichia coli]
MPFIAQDRAHLSRGASCTDRVTLVDVRKRQSKTVPYKEIERYGIDRNRSPLK